MQNKIEIKYKKTSDLIPYAKNSRTHSEEQINQIAASISEFGFTNPVLIDDEANIIAGHGRVVAAGKLGLQEVPTITLAGLSEMQKKAYVIADNKIALNAGWNDELLKQELIELNELGLDMSLLGFDQYQLDSFLGNIEVINDPVDEWKAMPEFAQDDKTSFRHVVVHFPDKESCEKFFTLIDQKDTGKTLSIWFPPQERMDTESKRYGN